MPTGAPASDAAHGERSGADEELVAATAALGAGVHDSGEESYVSWCRATAQRLAADEEHGQACAWFGHALTAAPAEGTAPHD
eukprot:7115274-Prymnesium_polylepis.1